MIPILLRDLRGRLALLAVVALVLYLLEPGFHQHGAVDPEFARELGPAGVAATLAYLAALSMIVLLAGFISTDRREGYARLLFAHPTSPLALYGLRWGMALGLALLVAAVFLLVGQWVAWGEVRGGAQGLLLALLAALVYGALMAFFSAALPRGDAWLVFLLFLPTFFPQILALLQLAVSPGVHQAVLFVLPPQTALQSVYQGLVEGGGVAWGAAAFVTGYAAVWLGLAVLVLRLRELP